MQGAPPVTLPPRRSDWKLCGTGLQQARLPQLPSVRTALPSLWRLASLGRLALGEAGHLGRLVSSCGIRVAARRSPRLGEHQALGGQQPQTAGFSGNRLSVFFDRRIPHPPARIGVELGARLGRGHGTTPAHPAPVQRAAARVVPGSRSVPSNVMVHTPHAASPRDATKLQNRDARPSWLGRSRTHSSRLQTRPKWSATPSATL